MKKLALLLAFFAAPLLKADGSTTALLTNRSTVGASPQIYAASGELGRESWFFVKTGSGNARLEVSLDSGVSYVALKAFTPGEGGNLITMPSCGGCRFRVYVTSASSTAVVSVGVTVSGSIVPATTP